MLKNKLYIILTIIILLGSCTSSENEELDEVHIFENYSFSKETDLIDRVQDVPDIFLDYLIDLDSKPEYNNYELNQTEKNIMEETLTLIPDSYKKVLKENLIGIYFVEDFWGSGLTDFVVDSNNDIYTIIILNPKLLHMNLNEAFLKKEESCFINNDADRFRLEVDISEEYNGILYVLLHEMTHAVDYTRRITPITHLSIKRYTEKIKSIDVVGDVWLDYNKISKEYNSDIFAGITFYGFNDGPYIRIEDAEYLYKELAKTPFVTLYSTLSWAEDLADFYTINYLVSKLHCDYEIKIFDYNRLVYIYSPFNHNLLKNRLMYNSFLNVDSNL